MNWIPRQTRTLVAIGLWSLCSSSVASAQNKIAHFEFDGPIQEKPQGESLLSMGTPTQTLHQWVERIRAAEKDDQVSALLVTFGSPSIGLAQIDELRTAFEKVDKPVYFHADTLSTDTYTLATSGSHISVTPTGEVWLMGMYLESPYLKGLLEKLDVEADFVHIGDFKSAGEMLYRTSPSAPAADNMNWLLDGLFESTVDSIAESRFSGNQVLAGAAIDHGTYTARQALDVGLIDSVRHRQDVTALLRERFGEDLVFVSNYGVDNGPELDLGNPFGLLKMIADLGRGPGEPKSPTIAVVHVNGMIFTGSEDVNPLGSSTGAYSTDIRLALDRASATKNIEAVVLRVDSPGGSALASEVIYDAVARVRAAGKPVVVSMGNVAASGGYYVSCGADRIIAGPNTITASIGVVGGKLVTTGLWDKLGVSWHEYKRGASADLMTSSRSWTTEERQRIHDWMFAVYQDFTGHIVEHRGTKLTKEIEEMAAGRVFSGRQALELGLIDELGTLDDALRAAAELANLGKYDVRVLPEPPSLFDFLENSGGEEDRLRVGLHSALTRGALGQRHGVADVLVPLLETLDPERASTLLLALQRLELLHAEHVVLMSEVSALRLGGR